LDDFEWQQYFQPRGTSRGLFATAEFIVKLTEFIVKLTEFVVKLTEFIVTSLRLQVPCISARIISKIFLYIIDWRLFIKSAFEPVEYVS